MRIIALRVGNPCRYLLDRTALNVHSIDFSNVLGSTAFDNVQVNAVPLPAAVFLLPAGLAAFGAARRRRPQA